MTVLKQERVESVISFRVKIYLPLHDNQLVVVHSFVSIAHVGFKSCSRHCNFFFKCSKKLSKVNKVASTTQALSSGLVVMALV